MTYAGLVNDIDILLRLASETEDLGPDELQAIDNLRALIAGASDRCRFCVQPILQARNKFTNKRQWVHVKSLHRDCGYQAAPFEHDNERAS